MNQSIQASRRADQVIHLLPLENRQAGNGNQLNPDTQEQVIQNRFRREIETKRICTIADTGRPTIRFSVRRQKNQV